MKKYKVLKIVGITYLMIGLALILPLSLTVSAYTGTSPVFMTGTQVKPYSYGVWRQGSTYYATNGLTGAVDYSGTNITLILKTVCEMGGLIFVKKGNYNLSTRLVIKLTEAPDSPVPFQLVGEGADTIFSYEGTGYAITVNTTWTTYQWIALKNFRITGVSKTSGRSGLLIARVGRCVVLDHINIDRVDIGVSIGGSTIDATNEVYLYNVRVVTANYGFYTSPSSTNEITFTNCQAVNTANASFYIEGGTSHNFFGGLSAPNSGYGMVLNYTWNAVLKGFRFEPSGSITSNLYLAKSGSYTTQGIQIDGCYFNGVSQTDYAIYIDSGKKITIDTPTSRLHNTSFLYLTDSAQEITIINPYVEDPFLISGETPTTLSSRMVGTVIEDSRIGIIVSSSVNVTEGDVLIAGAGVGLWSSTTTANDNVPSVVMYGSTDANKYCVIAISGITQVNNATSVSLRDTIVTHTVALQGTVNNSQTDPKKIIGYVVAVDSMPYILIS